jgi:hypothetical protein
MDQEQLDRFLKGVDIDGQNYNPLIADAFEHMKSNTSLVEFVQSDAAGYQAYLALRDTAWLTHTGENHMFGWINCSALVGLLRGKGEHPQHMWWGEHERDAPAFDPTSVAAFDELVACSGWKVTYRDPPTSIQSPGVSR